MYRYIMSEMTLFTCNVTVVKSDTDVMTSTGYSTRFPPVASLVQRVSDFSGWISKTAFTQVAFLYLGLLLCKMNYMVSVPACDFLPYDRRTSSVHIEFYILACPS